LGAGDQDGISAELAEGALTLTFLKKAMATKDKLDEFRGDANTALERSLSRLPDYPNLSAARPLGDAILVKDYPNLWREPTVGSIAFVRDALMSIDPLWGVGCGFAFQAADWLVEAVAPALKAGSAADVSSEAVFKKGRAPVPRTPLPHKRLRP